MACTASHRPMTVEEDTLPDSREAGSKLPKGLSSCVCSPKGKDGLAAARGDGGAEQSEADDQAENADQDDAAHDGQGHFDKIFHCAKGKFDKSR